MSGIAGIVRFDGGPTEPALVERMTAAMSFRGPDGIRHRVEGAVALGHCLLRTTPESLDEAQPLASDDGRVLLVLDGRVADPVELRRELEGRGVRLRDRSDAELVLRAYELWGPDCLRRFDGDFAFFAWDARSRTALCARDRMGNRPFHYHWRDGVFAFASDLRALHALPWVKRELNEGFLAEALADEWLSREETFWTGIVRLVAAHRMVVGANGSTPERYWSPDLEAPLPARKESDLAEAYLVILTEEVRREVEPLEGVADHVRVEVAALAGVHLDRLGAGGADALGVVAGLLVALDHRQRMAAGEPADGLDQQRRLARAGTGDEVDGEQAARLPFLAVGAGVGVVLGEDVLLDLHHAAGREAWRVGTMMMVVRMARRIAQAARRMRVLGSALDLRFALAATADCAHSSILYSTSSSLTRISVPPCTCSW